MNNNKRIEWIDITKGIGIILVVMGHSPISVEIKTIIYSFHVPLFFFISGYLFNSDKYKDFATFLKSRVKSLVAPYFLLSFICYFLFIYFEKEAYHYTADNLAPIRGIMTSNFGVSITGSTLWFLTCLFVVESLFCFIAKIQSKKTILLILFISSILGFSLSNYKSVWNIIPGLIALVFYGSGYIFKKSNINSKFFSTDMCIILIVICGCLGFINARQGIVNMYSSVYNNYFLYFISAYSGICACIILSQRLKSSSILTFLGKNTLTILAFHPDIFVLINFIIELIRRYYNITITVTNALDWGALYTFTSLIILVPVSIVINKFSPILVGKTTSIKMIASE